MLKLQNALLCATALFATSIAAADSASKEEITKAIKALTDKGGYSWKTTTVVPEGTQFRPGPTEGKTEKDGATHVKMTFNDNTTEAVIKGEKVAIKSEDSSWQSASELENEEGRGRFFATRMRNFRTPAQQAEDMLKDAKEVKKEGDTYVAQLTEEGAKNLMRFRRGGDGPEISNAKGSIKLWVKEGILTKYEYKTTGSMNFNGNDIDIDRTTTTEFKDVGTTKVAIPEGAQKKLS